MTFADDLVMGLADRLRVQYNLTAMHEFEEAADALDAKDARIKELERIVYLFVEADDDRDAGSITDAEYKARIMDWTNRAREALK